MRAILLGQDRYRRRYMALPHLGAVLVEGPEDLLSESKAASTLHLYLVHTAAEFSKQKLENRCWLCFICKTARLQKR